NSDNAPYLQGLAFYSGYMLSLLLLTFARRSTDIAIPTEAYHSFPSLTMATINKTKHDDMIQYARQEHAKSTICRRYLCERNLRARTPCCVSLFHSLLVSTSNKLLLMDIVLVQWKNVYLNGNRL